MTFRVLYKKFLATTSQLALVEDEIAGHPYVEACGALTFNDDNGDVLMVLSPGSWFAAERVTAPQPASNIVTP